MISAGIEGRLPCMTMTYPTEPWRGPPKQPPEFLRPLPKLPTRYNGINTTTAPNGTRLAPPTRPTPLPAHASIPSLKDEVNEEITPYTPYRLFPHPPHSFTHFNHYQLYQSPQYTQHMLRQNYAPSTPLTSLETYSPTTPTPPTPPSANSTTTFLPPPPRTTFSPPTSTAVKPGQSILRDKRTPPIPQAQTTPPLAQSQQQVSFKIPSGKEGSLKHRILTRPEDINRNIPLDLQHKSPGEAQMTRKLVNNEPQQTIVNRKPLSNDVMISKKPETTAPRKRLVASTMSPPRSPKKTINNNVVRSFNKGSLVQLFTGELRKIEDMRTEDFVLSAEKCPELRLADSTVVKIEENQLTGSAAITLTYNQRRTQVEVLSSMDHPYFVYGQGWASCNPEKTQQHFGLKVHRLQVGDILISLTPREPLSPSLTPSKSSTIMTTATTTAMTVRASNVQQRIPTSLEQPPLGSVNLNYIPNISTSIENNILITSSHSRTILTSDGNILVKSEQPPLRTLNINEPGPSGIQVQVQPINLHSSANLQLQSAPLSPNSLAARKRRWSAPDQMSDEEEHIRRHRVE